MRRGLKKTVDTVVMMGEAMALQKYPAITVNAIELEPEALALVFLLQRKHAAIPSDAVGRKAGTKRFVPMIVAGIPIRRQLDYPIVRQIQCARARIIKILPGRAGADAGVNRPFACAPLVAQM